jgi:hypothetical protein
MATLGRAVNHMTDQLIWMGLYYGAEPTTIGKRIQNVYPRYQNGTHTWNAHEWDVN